MNLSNKIEHNLAQHNLTIPELTIPAANYVPYTISGKHIFISGQLPSQAGQLAYQGIIGDNISLEMGYEAAKLCGINILACLYHALDHDWNNLKQCLKLGGFVNATPHFTDHPKIVNGASDLMVHILGDAGKHARFAVGAASLPFNVPVEVDAIFERI